MSSDSPTVTTMKLKSRAEVAERTLEFRFDKPAGFAFKAGQSVDLTLIDPPDTDAEGDKRAFSINSTPDDPELVFTTRLRDTAFKRVLRRMPLGSAVKLEGPFGSFTLHNKVSRPAVLLAGGIGVTPFRSITRWAAQQRLPHRIALLYANRRPEDAPFLAELAGYAEENPNFVFVPTMSELEGSRVPWAGERGNIDQALLDRVVKPLAEVGPPIYYAAGPAGMVAVLRATLRQAGVDDDDLRTEEFSGY